MSLLESNNNVSIPSEEWYAIQESNIKRMAFQFKGVLPVQRKPYALALDASLIPAEGILYSCPIPVSSSQGSQRSRETANRTMVIVN